MFMDIRNLMLWRTSKEKTETHTAQNKTRVVVTGRPLTREKTDFEGTATLFLMRGCWQGRGCVG